MEICVPICCAIIGGVPMKWNTGMRVMKVLLAVARGGDPNVDHGSKMYVPIVFTIGGSQTR